MSSKSKNTGLGKGLEGLIDINTEVNVNEINKEHSGSPLKVLINNIEPNPDQPRKYFKKDEMESLVESIRQKGILEPLLARKIDNQKFELIAGHRRLRAAKEAGLKEVPIVILEIGTDLKERLEIALVENLIRQNLNPIEEAESFARLENEFGKKDADIARLIGRDRSSVINSIRLLSLNSEIKDDIRFGRMTSGHGRAILSIKNKEKWPEARGIVLSRSLTVRQTEALAKKLNKGVKLSRSEGDGEKAYYESLEKGFTDALNGLKTKIHYKGKKKKIEITYHTNEEIENIMKKLGIENL